MYRIDEISKTLADLSDAKTIEEFFQSLLTEKEVYDISSRWELVKMLDQGISQRQIAKELKVSLCKITRGSKELKKENSVFKRLIDRYYVINRRG